MISLFPALLIAAQAAALPIDDETLALAREVAAHSPLAQIGPLQTAAEVEQIIADNPDLSAEEQDRLRQIGRERASLLGAEALEAEAKSLAAALSIDDLRAIADFNRSVAARHYREATPQVAVAVMQSLEGLDYKAEVREAFCAETRKLCPEPQQPDEALAKP